MLGIFRISDIQMHFISKTKVTILFNHQNNFYSRHQLSFVIVCLLNRVLLFVTPWTVAYQAPNQYSVNSKEGKYWYFFLYWQLTLSSIKQANDTLDPPARWIPCRQSFIEHMSANYIRNKPWSVSRIGPWHLISPGK